MRDIQKVDLGSVQIHKYVIADIVVTAIANVKGLSLAGSNLLGKAQEFLGIKKYPAVNVYVDKGNQVSISVKVAVKYGLSVQDVAAQAQDLIREAIEKTVDIDLKDININIRGIERGE